MSEVSDAHVETPMDGVTGNREKKWDPGVDKIPATDSLGGYGSVGMKAMSGGVPEGESGIDQRIAVARAEYMKRAIEVNPDLDNWAQPRLFTVTGEYVEIKLDGDNGAEVAEVLIGAEERTKGPEIKVFVRANGMAYDVVDGGVTNLPRNGGVEGKLAPASDELSLQFGAVLDYQDQGDDRYLGDVIGATEVQGRKNQLADGLEKSLKAFSK